MFQGSKKYLSNQESMPPHMHKFGQRLGLVNSKSCRRAIADQHKKIQSEGSKYPSKLISELMNSDSDCSEQQQQDEELFVQSDLVQFKSRNYQLSTPPPLVVANQVNSQIAQSHKQNLGPHNPRANKAGSKGNVSITSMNMQISTKSTMKQNRIVESNRCMQAQKQIKITQYKQLSQPQSHQPQNSITLQDASMIPDLNEHQLQRLRQQNSQLLKAKKSIQNQNRLLKRQITLLQEEMDTKDNVYEDLETKLNTYMREKERVEAKISELETEVEQLRSREREWESSRTSKYSSKRRRGQLSKYISNPQQLQIEETTRDKSPSCQKQLVQDTYHQVTSYIVNRVQQAKNKLMEQRMSASVEQIIQQFMTELVNLNEITVRRFVVGSSAKVDRTPTPSQNRFHCNQTNILSSSNVMFPRGSLFHQVNNISSLSSLGQSVTPPKKNNNGKQKSQQLQKLQKSLNKLKDMQKSLVGCTPNHINHNIARNNNADHDNHDKAHNSSSINHTNSLNNNLLSMGSISKDYNDYSSLDRSSIIGLDRSKSRRKKIFS